MPEILKWEKFLHNINKTITTENKHFRDQMIRISF